MYLPQLIENIRIKATTITNNHYIPDNILRKETTLAGTEILTLTEQILQELPNHSMNILYEIGTLQEEYEKLKNSGHMTKQDLCNLVIPFRDKYSLTDIQALQIAQNKIPLKEIADVLSNKEK